MAVESHVVGIISISIWYELNIRLKEYESDRKDYLLYELQQKSSVEKLKTFQNSKLIDY